MGVSSLTWLIAIHLHAEWSSHYVCSCYARSYNNVPGGHSDTIYVTAYMQMMVVCIYPYIILKWFQLSHIYYIIIIIYSMPSNETLQCSEEVLPT